MSYLSCVEIEPEVPADAAVIWLHGLGASGHDFEPIVPELRLPTAMKVRFVFPNAPSIPVTINNGMVMAAWYDILAMDLGRQIDQTQLLESAARTTALIDREIDRGIDSSRVVVAGFSQGGAVAYHSALTYPKPLAGLMALSSYFATADILEPHPANLNLPIQVFHGIYDPMVPEGLGKQALDHLKAWGLEPSYRNYPMQHAVCPQQVRDISDWLQQRLVADPEG